jgi:hypothetical protein
VRALLSLDVAFEIDDDTDINEIIAKVYCYIMLFNNHHDVIVVINTGKGFGCRL